MITCVPELITFGQAVVCATSHSPHHVELLSRLRVADPATSIETLFRNLTVEQRHNVLDSQLTAAERFWRRTGIHCSINVGADVLTRPDFLASMLAFVERAGGSFRLEVTEHDPLPPPAQANRLFRQLRRLQLALDLDDFGSGHARDPSIFSKYDFDAIKLDRQFIRNGLKNRNNYSMLTLIVRMIKSNDKQVIAEGVETAEDREALVNAGVELHQGYFYHKPAPLESMDVS